MAPETSRWSVRFDPRALKELRALGSSDQKRVLRFLNERVAGSANPRQSGKALTGELAGVWRYRVGDIRVLAQLQFDVLVVLVVEIGNRREVDR